jgi:hypothetical protein
MSTRTLSAAINPYTKEEIVADEAITLEALEAEAAAELEAEEAPASAEPEGEAKPVEGSEVEAESEEGASVGRAAHGKDKRVEVPVATLSKLRESRRQEREAKEALERQNRELIERLNLLNAPKAESVVPTLEQFDYDANKYQAALVEWQSKQMQSQLAEMQRQQLEQQQQQILRQRMEQEISEHYRRAASLGIPDYEDAERTVRDDFGDDAIDSVIDAIGEGSEKVLFHLGKNAEERQRIKDLIAQDPSGRKALARLGVLSSKLAAQPVQEKVSRAPAADTPLSNSSGSGAGSSAILKKLERLASKPDRTEFRAYKQQLIKSGHKSVVDQYDSKW